MALRYEAINKIENKNAALRDNADADDRAMKETTLSGAAVIHSANIVPNSASTAPETIAIGAAKERNSMSRTVNTSTMAIARTTVKFLNDACC